MTKELPTQPSDVTQLRHVNNLHLAEPRFNVPGRVDILVGSDVLEEAKLDNRITDNGVVIPESIFGWIVSGPVHKPEFEDKNPIITNTSSIEVYPRTILRT